MADRAGDDRTHDRWLLLRALIAFLAMPGIVAYALPLLLAPGAGQREPWQYAGLGLLAAGSALLAWCVRDFYVAGRGTLAPWSPPQRLVTVGLYRWSRNPMYLAVTVVLFGWATWFGSSSLALYALAVLGAFHVRVIAFEEPRLAATFGADWAAYRARVRRWL